MKTILAIALMVAMFAIPAALAVPNEHAGEHNPVMAFNEIESSLPEITDLPGFSNVAAPAILDFFAEMVLDETTPGFSGAKEGADLLGTSIPEGEPLIAQFTPAGEALDNAPGQNKEPV